jgi:hypothetical protein
MSNSARNVRSTYGSRARWRNEITSEQPTQAMNLPPGEVRIQPKGNGWLFIQIGRATHVKRFNLTEEELHLIIAQLAELETQRKQLATQKYRGRT